MAEHTYNNLIILVISMAHFSTNYWRYPESLNPLRMEVMNPASCAFGYWIKGAFEPGKTALVVVRDQMIKNTDTRCIPPLAYKISNPVILSVKHIKTKKSSRKLDHKFLNLFQIDKIMSPTTVWLILPQKWKTHPSFHVSEIEPFIPENCLVPIFTKLLWEVSNLEADKEYNIDEIKGSITCKNKILYYIKWLRYLKRRIRHL